MCWGEGGNSIQFLESTKILRFSTAEWEVSTTTRQFSTEWEESRKTRRLATGDERSSSDSFFDSKSEHVLLFRLDFRLAGGDFLSRFLVFIFSSFGRVVLRETARSSDFATSTISLSTLASSQRTSYRERVSAIGLWPSDSEDLKMLFCFKTFTNELFYKSSRH